MCIIRKYKKDRAQDVHALFLCGLLSICIMLLIIDSSYAESNLRLDIADNAIVEVLPKSFNLIHGKTQQLRNILQRDPDNIEVSIALSHQYLDYAKHESDKRYWGYAQAVLKPWWDKEQAPLKIRLLRADILQHQHQFQRALQDLDSITQQPKGDLATLNQAWLMKSIIHQARAQHRQSIGSCYALAETASAEMSTVCMASALHQAGASVQAYKMLQSLQSEYVELSIQRWLFVLRAEIAADLKLPIADDAFQKALQLIPNNIYLLNAYAEYLLKKQQAQKVLNLLASKAQEEVLLVQRVLAAKQLGLPVQEKVDRLKKHFAIAEQQNTLHTYAAARFALFYEGDVDKALYLAKENWKIQKNKIDAEILKSARLAVAEKRRNF